MTYDITDKKQQTKNITNQKYNHFRPKNNDKNYNQSKK